MEVIPVNLVETPAAQTRISCGNCIAACCLKNTVIPLSKKEAAWMEDHGSNIRPLTKEEQAGHRPPHHKGFYKLEEDCGNLAVDADTGKRVCAAYDERPGACRDFQEGGFGCQMFREARLPRPAEPVVPAGTEEFPVSA